MALKPLLSIRQSKKKLSDKTKQLIQEKKGKKNKKKTSNEEMSKQASK